MADDDSAWQRQRREGLDTFSIPIAEKARREFFHVKVQQLGKVAREERTVRQAMDTLRKKYDQLSATYLKVIGTTYEVWCTHGPKGEWDELIEARRDEAVWDRLVENIDKREDGR